MKIDELIARLGLVAEYLDQYGMHGKADVCRKAAEVIKLLWEVARENRLAEYHRQIDELRGDDET